MQLSTNLLVLCLIHTKATEHTYVPNFQPFLVLATFLDLYDPSGESFLILSKNVPDLIGPDICASCLKLYGHVVSGNVRERCVDCHNLQWSQRFYTDPWPYRIANLLNTSSEMIVLHIAEALLIHKHVRETKPNEQSKPQIQPDPEPTTGHSGERTRRFSLLGRG